MLMWQWTINMMMRNICAVVLTVVFMLGLDGAGGAESGFAVPTGWTSRPAPSLRQLKSIALQVKSVKKYTVPRHLLIYAAPQPVEGFFPNLVIDSVDTSIGAQVSANRLWLYRDGWHLVIDRPLRCQAHIRAELLEFVHEFKERLVDGIQMEIGRVDARTSYSVTYSRRAGTHADPSAQKSLTALCYQRVFDTSFIDRSPNLRLQAGE